MIVKEGKRYMSPSQVIDDAKTKFLSAKERFEAEAKKLRTGRAHPDMLDGVVVEAYGQKMPIIQVATITAPEARLLQLTPFDPNNLQAIADAIRNEQALGLNPTDDGRIVRIPIPALTEERRREIAKMLGTKLEEANIALRNARHDALKTLDTAKKDKDIGEDEYIRLTKQLDDLLAKHKEQIETLSAQKEKEILTI